MQKFIKIYIAISGIRIITEIFISINFVSRDNFFNFFVKDY